MQSYIWSKISISESDIKALHNWAKQGNIQSFEKSKLVFESDERKIINDNGKFQQDYIINNMINALLYRK